MPCQDIRGCKGRAEGALIPVFLNFGSATTHLIGIKKSAYVHFLLCSCRCEWLEEHYFCNQVGASLPCYLFWEEGSCPTDRCKVENMMCMELDGEAPVLGTGPSAIAAGGGESAAGALCAPMWALLPIATSSWHSRVVEPPTDITAMAPRHSASVSYVL